MNIRENKAITLIALVVTIVVILILSSISLGIVLGNNSIITLAKKSKENIESVQDKTQSKLNTLYSQMHGGNVVDSGNSGNPGGNTGGSGLTGKDIKRDNYGEYVDYGLDINGNDDTTDDWKIFYTNEDGRIFLIAADYVPNTCKAITEAIDENHTKMTTKDSYKYCWTSIPTYHCNDGHNTTLNQDKEQCSFPNLFMPSGDFCSSTNHYYCSDHVGTGTSGNTNSRCASALQCTGNWQSFVENSKQKEYADYAIGGPTLEMWVASWNKVHGTATETSVEGGITLFANGNSNSSSKYGYYVGTSENCTTTYCDLSKCEGYNDPLYFPHKDNNLCYGYWLASPSAHQSNILIYIYCNGGVSGAMSSISYCGVRPIVCLKSEVKLAKNTSKSSDEKIVYDLSMANN